MMQNENESTTVAIWLRSTLAFSHAGRDACVGAVSRTEREKFDTFVQSVCRTSKRISGAISNPRPVDYFSTAFERAHLETNFKC